MLKQERVKNVLDRLQRDNVKQILIFDPCSIYWLLGAWFFPGERFLGLLLQEGKAPVLYLNALFDAPSDIGVKIVRFTDTDDVIALVEKDVNPYETLGVDKKLQAGFLLKMMERNLAKSFVNESTAVDYSRAVKDQEEIEKMRKSSAINDQAMLAFKALVHASVTEAEIASKTLDIYLSLGAEGYSFDPIVSFGKNAADPHHMPDDTVLKEGDCILFDIGCKYEGYCSDMTRTFYYKKEPDERIRNIYNLVKEANRKAEEAIRPGVELHTFDDIARNIITKGGYGSYFNHRLGHFCGLEDHEYGDVSSVNKKETEVGNIFSIEPGIYLSGDTGVRIEDLVLVTESGHEVLNHLPKELEIID